MNRTILCAAAAVVCFAGSTRTWNHSTRADFEKGKLTKVSLRSDGRLSLAPVLKELYDPSSPYLWAVAENSRGAVFAGGSSAESSSAKLYEIDPSGKGKVLADLPGLTINAIAVDARDRVYAATSPDGKIYRITGDNRHEVFYDPKAKYIWAMAFARDGSLFAATGDKGEIHKVAPSGAGSVFFRSEEAHVRSLALDAKGNVLAGTEPGGLVIRVSPAGEGFVLHQADRREITSVAVHPDGSIYAAAVGSKSTPPAPPPPAPAPPTPPGPAGAARPAAATPAPVPSLGAAISGGSEVWRIDADGYPRRVWTDASEIAYSIAFDPQGRPWIGTGNKGNIYRIDSGLHTTLLTNAAPTQVTGLLAGRQDRMIAITGNIGKVLQLGPGVEKEGSFEGEVLDADFFSYWGRVHYEGTPAGGGVILETRSGNLDLPQKNWSPWAPVALTSAGGRIGSPAARFLQYRITLQGSGTASPEISALGIAYLPRNVAPVIELIAPTPPNYRFPDSFQIVPPAQSLILPALLPPGSTPLTGADNPSSSMMAAKGHLGARWAARDANGDALRSRVEIRGVNESVWKLVKDEVKERQVSWDTTGMADGEYRLRVTVTDLPSNPPAQALADSLESGVFTVDNTPPAIEGLAASRNGGRVEARWRAADVWNVVTKAEYSVNGGEWLPVEPTTRLSDSRQHDYTLTIENAGPGELTIAVRASDAFNNHAVAQAVVR